MAKSIPSIGIMIPDILLPNTTVDLKKRAVVACDQYTSQPEYRQEVANFVGQDPSTLSIIYPEVYLEEENKAERIQAIKQAMNTYFSQGILENKGECCVLIDRKTSHADSRKGLILALDLEAYDYSKESQTLIRATEGTIVDRLPPRIEVRKEATIESPHIMVLIDDESKTVIEPLFANKDKYTKLYQTELMMNGGYISGYKIEDPESIQNIVSALTKLADPASFQQRYQVGPDKGVLLFAMGDGNHSLATAKAIREEKKQSLTPQQKANHPARFALIELVNVHDDGLTFEPIHRVLFNINPSNLLNDMKAYFSPLGTEVTIETFASKDQRTAQLKKSDLTTHYFTFVYQGTYGQIALHNPKLNLEVGNLQAFLDDYLKLNPEAKIDYVHGEDVTENLGMQPNNIGFLLPIMDKKDFFKTVVVDGALPRKTFSMGEAEEKRFYLECRKIV
ncbi:MAG: DUF1015 domain-containing protein [Candidatus Absconditabacteria bacterium]|nr:DUF1015 domain-containing protein [Candidatus Absconditabacteria bacterium]